MSSLASAAMPNNNARGIVMMLACVLFFTTMDAIAKGLVGGYPTMQVVFFRFAGQILIVALILRGTLVSMLATQFPFLHFARAVLQFATVALFFASLNYIPLAEAQALTDISPVLITLGAALFLGESLTKDRIVGVLLAMVGAMIVIRPGYGIFSMAALLPIASAFTYAGSALITRRVGPYEHPWTAMLYTAGFGMLASGVTLPFEWVPIATGDIWRFTGLGVCGAFAQLCIIRSFSMAEASVVAPFAYAGIICAIGWGILLYGDYPDLATIFGALVIVSAGLYVWQRETQVARRAA
ncbi:MAG: EamA/RhaT family transporter [Cereibacter sphaeroides]|uniref:EamA/RhaT family transporter n=1 Tax=Cereibacter sphaeroides TaxID=1063 RepID=A0A2W5UPR4_CERSP|nr:MAG: EamA/RhaT family transporter [Cereibacter sphaeroides]